MPTHESRCIVCEEPCYCCDDTHALRCGAGCGQDGTKIEFCSLACFDQLASTMQERRREYLSQIADASPTRP